jgi:phage shock protein C
MATLTASEKDQTMTKTTPLPLRNDTILGVCEAIGRDFGFNPIWLRLAFIVPLFFSATLTILAYLGLGAVIGLINWFSPDEQAAEQLVAEQLVDVQATAIEEDEALPIAA